MIDIKKIIVGQLGASCYVIKQKIECVVIDPGDDVQKIINAIEGSNLRYILLTHGHFDHVLALEPLHEKFPNTPIYMGEDDEVLLRVLSEQNLYSNKALNDIKVTIKHIDEKKQLKLANTKIRVIETPGHSHGSLCYLIDGNLFSGDTLFYHTIGRTDFWTSDPIAMQDSLKILAKLPKTTKVYPGHGRTTIIEEELNNGYLSRYLGC